MPTLGGQRRRSPMPTVLIVLAVLLAVAWLWHRHRAAPATSPLPTLDASSTTASRATALDAGALAAVLPAPSAAAQAAAQEELARAGVVHLHVEVQGALETAVVQATGEADGRRLAQVLVRALVWWLSVPGDLRRGDVLDALYELRSGEDAVIHALRYRSSKANRTFSAYLTKASSSRWPHLYTADGNELELRLEAAPLDDYQQVTSLLRDGRGHRGVDWKTPVGSPVKAPFDAVVVRKNWGWKQNGNCLEIRQLASAGRTVILLHLAEPPTIAVGAHVARGEVVAASGNTGHSYAPHLHYQLQAGQTVLDPFVVQPTMRRKLSDGERAELALEVARLDHLLDLP